MHFIFIPKKQNNNNKTNPNNLNALLFFKSIS